MLFHSIKKNKPDVKFLHMPVYYKQQFYKKFKFKKLWIQLWQ